MFIYYQQIIILIYYYQQIIILIFIQFLINLDFQYFIKIFIFFTFFPRFHLYFQLTLTLNLLSLILSNFYLIIPFFFYLRIK